MIDSTASFLMPQASQAGLWTSQNLAKHFWFLNKFLFIFETFYRQRQCQHSQATFVSRSTLIRQKISWSFKQKSKIISNFFQNNAFWGSKFHEILFVFVWIWVAKKRGVQLVDQHVDLRMVNVLFRNYFVSCFEPWYLLWFSRYQFSSVQSSILVEIWSLFWRILD